MKKLLPVCICLFSIFQAQAQLNITQLGHVDYQALHGSNLSNLWGYTDENGNEYAIVGTEDGVSIVDVTNPATASEIFYQSGSNTVWREVKTYGDYAYISTESTDGIMIIDLGPLPGSTSLTVSYFHGAPGNLFQTAHSLFIDENGVLYLNGSNIGNGGVIMYDVAANPTNPPQLGSYDTWYVHDCYARGDTLYAAHIYDGFVSIVDVSNKSNPVIIGGPQNTPKTFAHNVWIDQSGDHMFTTDEVTAAWIGSYDISNLTNISEIDRVRRSETLQPIPHNTYWLNDYLVTSYYRDGVTIHDALDPANLIEVGNFDTSPFSGDGFNGAWGVYPYFPSGNLIVSDIEQGLFILGPTYTRACYLVGTVTDQSNGNPINLADVVIMNNANFDATNTTGAYATGVAVAGNYDVIYSKPGYIPDTIFNIALTNGNTVTQNVQLVPFPSFTLNGQVKDNSNNGIMNAQVLVQNSVYTYTASTDGNGNFTIPGFSVDPANENYDVTAGIWGYVTECQNLTINQTTNNNITVTLQAGYYDDFTFDFGWTPTGNASSGSWERGEPVGTTINGNPCNPDFDVTGDCNDKCYVTGNGGGSAGNDDVDNGAAILLSPVFSAPNAGDQVSFYLWMTNAGGSGAPNDSVRVILNDNGVDVQMGFAVVSNFTQSTWNLMTYTVSTYTTNTSGLRLKIRAADVNPGHVLEAGIDQFMVNNPNGIPALQETHTGVRLFPNPADAFITLVTDDAAVKISQVIIFDMSGKMVLQSGNVNTIPVASLSQGMYNIRVKLSDGVVEHLKFTRN